CVFVHQSTSPLFSLPCPPHTPLYTFPYTTLFRSPLRDAAPPNLAAGVHRFGWRAQRKPVSFGDLRHVRAEDLHVGVVPVQHGDLDRKSTRLNSSHGSISYAVFCLKKKNKTLKRA